MAPKPDSDEEEDTPFVTELKVLDDKYLEVFKKFEKEEQAIRRRFTEQQKPLLEERSKALINSTGAVETKTGTPALPGFWAKVLTSHPAGEDIAEHDEPVLQYLKDIKCVDLDPDDADKGCRLQFIFAENPYFTNAVLSKEVHIKAFSRYNGDYDVAEVRGCDINWKDGRDVTVAVVKKKAKGGGAKKTKQKASEKLEPRQSFFRSCFRSLKEGGKLPDEAMEELQDCEIPINSEEGALACLMSNEYQRTQAIRDNLIPWAVRWYTGEASVEDSDDDDDEDDDDDDDDDSDDDESPASRGRKGKGSPKTKPSKGPGPKKEAAAFGLPVESMD